MIRINLLPGGAQARRAPTRAAAPRAGALPKLPGDPRVAALGAVAVLLLVFAALAWWRTGAARTELQTRVERATEDSVRLERTILLMQQLEARRDTVEQKIDVIRSVDGRRYTWPHLLDEISRSVPPYTWLAKISATDDDDRPGSRAPAAPPRTKADSARVDSLAREQAARAARGPAFTVEGNTGSTQALTRLMKNMEASPMIREVALVTSEQATQDGRTFLKFTLEARFETPDSAFIETVPVLTPR